MMVRERGLSGEGEISKIAENFGTNKGGLGLAAVNYLRSYAGQQPILDDGGESWFKESMKITLILLNVLIVSLLNAGNPNEEAGSKHKNAEAENRKRQLIQTLENSDVKLYYEKDFPGKDAPPRKNARVNGEKISGKYVKFAVASIFVDKGGSKKKYVFRVIPYINGKRDGVEIYYRPDATISERHWYEKGIFKKAESYDTNGKWDWRRDEDGKSYFNN